MAEQADAPASNPGVPSGRPSSTLGESTMETYFVITRTDSGLFVEEFDQAELLDRLDEGTYSRDHFCAHLESTDPNEWVANGTLIIKGKIVVPVVKTKKIEYEIE